MAVPPPRSAASATPVPPDVRLRRVRAADLPAFLEHQRDAPSARAAAFVPDDAGDAAAHADRWRRRLADPAIVARTVCIGDRVAGHVIRFPGDGALELAVWIGPEHQGRGVGTAALRAFLAAHPERPVHARAAADHAASIRMLESSGFRRVGTGRGFAAARGTEIDEHHFRLEVAPADRGDEAAR